MKENSFNQDTPAFDAVLAQTIARHFQGAVAEAIDALPFDERPRLDVLRRTVPSGLEHLI